MKGFNESNIRDVNVFFHKQLIAKLEKNNYDQQAMLLSDLFP